MPQSIGIGIVGTDIMMALRIDPNKADVHAMRTDLLVMDGRPLEAIESIARAMRLNPRLRDGTVGSKAKQNMQLMTMSVLSPRCATKRPTVLHRVRSWLRHWHRSDALKKRA
jgi:hypothetical protein